MRIGVITLTLAFSMAFAFLILAGMPPASDAGPCPSTLDGDAIGDCVDNCSEKDNGDQLDTNLDGYGNICDPDYNQDNVVGLPDKGILLSVFGKSEGAPGYNPDVDLTGDDVIGLPDKGVLLSLFGKTPGPSGRACAGVIPCP